MTLAVAVMIHSYHHKEHLAKCIVASDAVSATSDGDSVSVSRERAARPRASRYARGAATLAALLLLPITLVLPASSAPPPALAAQPSTASAAPPAHDVPASAAPAIPEGRTAEMGKRYPTADEVYYVIACMDRNGHDAAGLHECSCAINALEQRLTFDQYNDAAMVITARQAGGRNAGIFRDAPSMKRIVETFVTAQRAANQQCFGGPPQNSDAHQAGREGG